MNDDAQLIKSALDRRFARAGTPACPDGAWHAATAHAATVVRRTGVPRNFAYAAALLAVVTVAGLAAQASSTVQQGYLRLMAPFASSKPLQPIVHRADRLTIAQAQRRMPFAIVVPAGLPANTRLLYAHVVSEKPVPRVALFYEAHVGSRYYRININETTVAAGPPVAHFKWLTRGHGRNEWTVPLRRWKHGAVVMEFLNPELPAAMSDEIVRANTM